MGKKVTIYVAFLKCHSDPKFRLRRGRETDDINQLLMGKFEADGKMENSTWRTESFWFHVQMNRMNHEEKNLRSIEKISKELKRSARFMFYGFEALKGGWLYFYVTNNEK